MIVDECHYGATDRQAHDTYVNDCNRRGPDNKPQHGPWQGSTEDKGDADLLSQPNFVTLLVSATPYCMLSRNSRIPDVLFIPASVTDQQLNQIGHGIKRLDVFQKQEKSWCLQACFLPRRAQLSIEETKLLLADKV